MTSKDVKILFDTILKYQWSKGVSESERTTAYFEIIEVLAYIKKQARKKRFQDIQGDKFCFLENYTEVTTGNRTIVKGFFKSARNQFRPNIINRTTGKERENPKLITEGDIEKTHFAILIDKDQKEVFLIREYNYYGLTMNNIMDYLSKFNRNYLEFKDLPKNYTLRNYSIAKDGFLEALRSLRSAKIADVYFDKKLLGSEALNFSNRTISLKNELKLTIGATRGESLKETAIDLFNNLNSGRSDISKIRVGGQDQLGNEVIIDTSFMNKIEFLRIDRNPLTGELNSTQIYSGFQNILESL